MKTKLIKQIGTREFLRNQKKIRAAVKRGQQFEVLDRTTPVFKVVSVETTTIAPIKKKFTIKELAQFQFKSGDPHLAENIDHYLYGTSKRNNS